MSEAGGFVVEYRKIMQWEWYTDVNTAHLFRHCIYKANYETKKWQGIEIKRGSFVTSLPTLSTETGLSIRSVRTAISKLESSGDIICTITNKYRIITITNYDKYQCLSAGHGQIDSQTTGKTTGKRAVKRQSKRQSNDIQPDSQTTTTNNINKRTSEGVRLTGAQPSHEEKKTSASLDISPPMAADVGSPSQEKPKKALPLFTHEWKAYCESQGMSGDDIWQRWAALDNGRDLSAAEIAKIRGIVNGGTAKS